MVRHLFLSFIATLSLCQMNAQSSTTQNDAEGNVSTVWVDNGDRKIYGELFTPDAGSRGTVIVSHGFNGTHHYGRNYFDVMGRLGYSCYVFDFPCGSVNSSSDSNTLNMSILDEVEDLKAIVAEFKSQDPTKDIILIGESQGGLVSALAAASLKKDIRRMVLVYPALCIPDNWRERYPRIEDIPEVTELWGVRMGRRFFEEIHDLKPLDIIGDYSGPVLIVQGDQDAIVSMKDSGNAATLYNDAVLHIIKGAGHGFNPEEFRELEMNIESFCSLRNQTGI